MRHFITLLFVLASTGYFYGQQKPLSTQYMFNGLVINPAYAGSQQALSVTLHAREQWVGVEGAPSAQTVSAHVPINKYKTGLGLLVTHNTHTVFNETSVYASYAHRIKMRDGFFAMGLQASIDQKRSNLADAVSLDTNDPLFAANVESSSPNFGAGVYYVSKKYYWGFSVPHILNLRISNLEQTTIESRNSRHYYLSGGLIFDVDRDVKIRTQGLIKLVRSNPLQLDVNASAILRDRLWLGASWRSFSDISALVQYKLNNQFRLGYSYDLPTSSDFRTATHGSHEVMLNYTIKLHRQKVCETYL